MAEYVVRWFRDGRQSVASFKLDQPPEIGANFWVAARRYVVKHVDMQADPHVITVDFPALEPRKFKELYD